MGSNSVLLINTGLGFFVADTTTLTQSMENSTSPSWDDVDNDGRLDLMIAQWNSSGQGLFLYRNTGATLQLYPFRTVPYDDKRIFSPRFADVNNDRLADLLITADFLQSQLYRNRGSGLFERVTSGSGAATDEKGMGAAVGDYDNDGDLDWFVSSIRDHGSPEGVWGVTGNRPLSQ